jgi:hypothetical protein
MPLIDPNLTMTLVSRSTPTLSPVVNDSPLSAKAIPVVQDEKQARLTPTLPITGNFTVKDPLRSAVSEDAASIMQQFTKGVGVLKKVNQVSSVISHLLDKMRAVRQQIAPVVTESSANIATQPIEDNQKLAVMVAGTDSEKSADTVVFQKVAPVSLKAPSSAQAPLTNYCPGCAGKPQ